MSLSRTASDHQFAMFMKQTLSECMSAIWITCWCCLEADKLNINLLVYIPTKCLCYCGFKKIYTRYDLTNNSITKVPDTKAQTQLKINFRRLSNKPSKFKRIRVTFGLKNTFSDHRSEKMMIFYSFLVEEELPVTLLKNIISLLQISK